MQNVFRDIWEEKLWLQYRQEFKDVTREEEGLLRVLDGYIKTYHGLKKTEIALLEPRAAALEMIERVCKEYLKGKQGRMEAKKGDPRNLWVTKPDPKDSSKTIQVPAQGESSVQKGVGTHTVYDNPMTHKVYSLGRRARLKADYLKGLKAMYADPSTHTAGDPTKFVKTITSPQPHAGQGFGLVMGVQMEFKDPAHRDFELGAPNTCGYLLETWIQEVNQGKTTLPFFMWLEEAAITLRKGEARNQSIGHVKYLSDEERQAYLLTFASNVVDGLLFSQKFQKGGHFNTTALTGDDPYWLGYAAFVVSTGEEWFAFQHEPGAMHHSSPLAGGAVKAAGMIRVESGKVTAISNKSGHYRPDLSSLLWAVEYLSGKNVFSANAQVHLIDANTAKQGHPTVYDVASFLQLRFQQARPQSNPPGDVTIGLRKAS